MQGTIRQERSPAHLLPRIVGLSTASIPVAAPIGVLVTGFLIDGLGLHQTMPVSSGLAERIVARASVGELAQCVAAEGVRNLRDAALARVRDGTTSIAEALTATPAA